MTSNDPDPTVLANAAMKGGHYNWEDALCLDDLLTEDELAIRDMARAYAQNKLMPRILEANRHETFDVTVLCEMA